MPLIEKLKARGIRVYVVFWAHASRGIREVATQLQSINPFLNHLRR